MSHHTDSGYYVAAAPVPKPEKSAKERAAELAAALTMRQPSIPTPKGTAHLAKTPSPQGSIGTATRPRPKSVNFSASPVASTPAPASTSTPTPAPSSSVSLFTAPTRTEAPAPTSFIFGASSSSTPLTSLFTTPARTEAPAPTSFIFGAPSRAELPIRTEAPTTRAFSWETEERPSPTVHRVSEKEHKEKEHKEHKEKERVDRHPPMRQPKKLTPPKPLQQNKTARKPFLIRAGRPTLWMAYNSTSWCKAPFQAVKLLNKCMETGRTVTEGQMDVYYDVSCQEYRLTLVTEDGPESASLTYDTADTPTVWLYDDGEDKAEEDE